MPRLAYSLVFYLIVPFALLRLLYRSLRVPGYRQRWKERFGFFQLPGSWDRDGKALWIHAVSVGETVAAVPLINLLLKRYPERNLVITTMTPTGSERVRALFGDSVFHVYLPYDLPGAMARLIYRLNPGLLIIMETELWPNLLHFTRLAGCRTLLVNARLSEKSATGYRRLATLTRQMLNNLNLIAAQASPDADRFIALGAEPERVRVTGSLKFDISPPARRDQLPPVFHRLTQLDRPILVAGSTREGEEEKLLAGFRQCLSELPELLLILVPRHPERFNSVDRLCNEQGLNTVRRSSNRDVDADTQVLLGDSMGEMWNYYAVADLAFVGGSLVDCGCHNVLEPAALGIPVLIGPSRFNFETICDLLQKAGALVSVSDSDDLARQVVRLLGSPQLCQAMGKAGRKTVESNRGCLHRLALLIDEQLQD